MQAIAGVALSAALLLVGSGAAKLANPGPAAQLLAALRLPGWRRLPQRATVRAGAVGEVVVGAALIGVGDRVAAIALAACYLVFTAVVLASLARGSRRSCGCFGSADAPLGRAHLVVDLLAAAAAIALAAKPAGAFGGLSGLHGVAAPVLAVQVLLLSWLGYLAITALPSLAATRRRVLDGAA